jgi:hypothetical protein
LREIFIHGGAFHPCKLLPNAIVKIIAKGKGNSMVVQEASGEWQVASGR